MEQTAYMVYHQSAESYHSVPELPVHIFTDRDDAIAFAITKGGYGLGTDWFVKAVPLN